MYLSRMKTGLASVLLLDLLPAYLWRRTSCVRMLCSRDRQRDLWPYSGHPRCKLLCSYLQCVLTKVCFICWYLFRIRSMYMYIMKQLESYVFCDTDVSTHKLTHKSGSQWCLRNCSCHSITMTGTTSRVSVSSDCWPIIDIARIYTSAKKIVMVSTSASVILIAVVLGSHPNIIISANKAADTSKFSRPSLQMVYIQDVAIIYFNLVSIYYAIL